MSDTSEFMLIVFLSFLIVELITRAVNYFRRDFYQKSREFIFSNVKYNPVLTGVIVHDSTVIFISDRFHCHLYFKVRKIVETPHFFDIHVFGRVPKGEGGQFAEMFRFVGAGHFIVKEMEEHDYLRGHFYIVNFMEKVELPWEKYGGRKRKKRLKLPWALPVLRPALQPAHQPL